MSVIIVTHKVSDYLEWKRYYDGEKKRREEAGIKELAMGRKMDEPDRVYMVYEFSDSAAFQSMLGDEDFMKRMEEAGVVGVPQVIPLV